MALVEFFQPTDMSSLISPIVAGGHTIARPGSFDIYNDNFESYVSLTGTAFYYPFGSILAGGTVNTVSIDTSDVDLTSNIIITNLSFHPDALDIFDVNLQDNLLAAVGAVLAGNDVIVGTSGDDTLLGFAGNDTLRGGGGLNLYEGGPGADRLVGGPGPDQAQYTFAATGVVADLLHPNLNTGEAKGDTYVSIDSLRGSTHSDVLRGNNGPNNIGGWLGGNDHLFGRGGNDVLATGSGNDLLDGGTGKDRMDAGSGADRFDFNAIADSVPGANRDVINGFSDLEGDRIDMSTIDANTAIPGNQAFVFIGADTFAHFHSLHPGVIGMIRFSDGIVHANVNAALADDFQISVPGPTALVASDFIL